jgi:hypothetical protein
MAEDAHGTDVHETASTIGAVIGAIAGAVALAKELTDWAERSIVLEINNMSADTFELVRHGTSSGDLQQLPRTIEPFNNVIVAAASGSFGEGAVGNLGFRARDVVLLMDYSNPVVGENDLDASFEGARVREFRVATSAGPGNKHARFRCDVWQDWQDHWRFCPKCRAIFSPGPESRCPAGGPHEPLGWNYILLHDVSEGPNLQATWRYCARCRGLFGEGDGNGICPAGGPHTPLGWRYCVPHDLPGGNHLQPGWRFCPKCRALFGEADGNGVCPAGGPHDPLGWPYLMAFASPI